jgi:hypothetical protein
MPAKIINDVAARLSLVKKKQGESIHVSEQVIEAARGETSDVLRSLGSSADGLSLSEIESRQETYGFNEVAAEVRHGWGWQLLVSLRNPLVILLGSHTGSCNLDTPFVH